MVSAFLLSVSPRFRISQTLMWRHRTCQPPNHFSVVFVRSVSIFQHLSELFFSTVCLSLPFLKWNVCCQYFQHLSELFFSTVCLSLPFLKWNVCCQYFQHLSELFFSTVFLYHSWNEMCVVSIFNTCQNCFSPRSFSATLEMKCVLSVFSTLVRIVFLHGLSLLPLKWNVCCQYFQHLSELFFSTVFLCYPWNETGINRKTAANTPKSQKDTTENNAGDWPRW